jgi:hypothetical protein
MLWNQLRQGHRELAECLEFQTKFSSQLASSPRPASGSAAGAEPLLIRLASGQPVPSRVNFTTSPRWNRCGRVPKTAGLVKHPTFPRSIGETGFHVRHRSDGHRDRSHHIKGRAPTRTGYERPGHWRFSASLMRFQDFLLCALLCFTSGAFFEFGPPIPIVNIAQDDVRGRGHYAEWRLNIPRGASPRRENTNTRS